MKYDPKTKRFRSEKGRFLSREEVRTQIEKTVERVGRKNRDLTGRLNSGEIDLKAWKKQMRENIKTMHTLTAAVGKGGRKQMTKSDWGKVGAEIKKQYKYLDKFESDLKKKKVSPKAAEYRATLYARNARVAFADMESRANEGRPCRRVLHASESCSECRAWANKGYVDDQPRIGSLKCGTGCKCSLEYK